MYVTRIVGDVEVNFTANDLSLAYQALSSTGQLLFEQRQVLQQLNKPHLFCWSREGVTRFKDGKAAVVYEINCSISCWVIVESWRRGHDPWVDVVLTGVWHCSIIPRDRKISLGKEREPAELQQVSWRY